MNNYAWILDIAAALLLLGLLLAGVYEMLAIINLHISFTPNFPPITAIVRPWLATHKLVGVTIAALVVGAVCWLILHFYLPA